MLLRSMESLCRLKILWYSFFKQFTGQWRRKSFTFLLQCKCFYFWTQTVEVKKCGRELKIIICIPNRDFLWIHNFQLCCTVQYMYSIYDPSSITPSAVGVQHQGWWDHDQIHILFCLQKIQFSTLLKQWTTFFLEQITNWQVRMLRMFSPWRISSLLRKSLLSTLVFFTWSFYLQR